jgi:hypothetical protein
LHAVAFADLNGVDVERAVAAIRRQQRRPNFNNPGRELMSAETLAACYAEGRLIRFTWADTDDEGRQRLCLYTALAGDPSSRPSACPAELCPRWLAKALPWIDDSGTFAAWPGVVARVVAVAPKLGRLRGEVSERLQSRCLAHILRDVVGRGGSLDTQLKAATRVLELLELHGSGGEASDERWVRAIAAAGRAAAVASNVRGQAAAVCRLSRKVAEVAVFAAHGEVKSAALEAASTEAEADRLIDAVLTEIERTVAELAP